MAWIESHQEMQDHPKLFHLCELSQLSQATCIGRLHMLWWWCLKFAEDGDLSRYRSSQIPAIETDEFRAHLRAAGWLDGDLIHDWIDYAGLYLTKKYSTGNIDKLKMIWMKHGYKYGKGKGKFHLAQVNRKRIESEQKANIPNQPNLTVPDLTKPNLTVVVGNAHERKLGELEALSLSEELQSWAQQEFGVCVPQDVLEEFKAYWREQKKLRTDWTATLKSRVRQLVSRGVLKPKQFDLQRWGREEEA